ncbi:MAG: PIG-L family deacetylase [Planctomycetes bacterium]|nr:PIG-L family deacetylase [Planctomycetota bacterium]
MLIEGKLLLGTLKAVAIGCVGAWGSRRLLRRIHRITHRLPMKLREIAPSKVLVVAPHMDDEVIGPGGALALHQRCGSEVQVVFCAAGADPAVDQTRKREALACAELMGFSTLHWLDFPEGGLSSRENELAVELAEVLNEVQPQQVFVPYPTDHHRDHTAVAAALASAIRSTKWQGEVWCFEVWSPSWPNTAVDISSVVEQKRNAISLHESQVAGLHYAGGILGLNRYRALRVYVDYAEAFWVAPEKKFVELAEEMSRV